jgi:uncharacterized metal-binding protein YceD (DUF177 family)
MDPFLPYQLPVKGLGPGVHTYHFQVGADFFALFPNAPVADGAVAVTLTLDKRVSMLELTFAISGTVHTACDRCNAPIDLPISGEQHLLVKYSVEEQESDDVDVMYIHPEAPRLDVSGLVYEFVCLAIPLIKAYDCAAEDPPPCDQEMLNFLEAQEEPTPDEGNNPFRDALKNWKNNE